ncbi:hypothetical protein L7F22_017169 [Adiantum nelumboides]|nr:hypothetical protein [Adiantum nelumboides]
MGKVFTFVVEFAYNNTIHSSTGKAPFEIVEGAMKVPPFLSTKDKIFEADEYTRDLDTAFAKVRETLQKSQEQQKKGSRSSPTGDVPDDGEPDEQPEVEENEEIFVPEQILAHKDTKRKGKETIDGHSSQHADSRMFYDDVLSDKDNDCQTASLLADTRVYDSIHGEFWMNDPYYQEFEAFGFQDGRSSLEDKNLGINDFALASPHVNNADTRTDPQTTIAEADNFTSEETCKSFHEPAGLTDRNICHNADYQTTPRERVNGGEDGVRKVESAQRPLVNFSSLQETEVGDFENRSTSGNGESDETNLEHRIDANGALTAVASTAKYDIADFDKVNTPGHAKEEGEDLADAIALPVVEQVGQIVEQVTDFISDSFMEQVVNVVDQVGSIPQVAEQVVLKMVDQVTEALPDPVVEQVGQAAEQVTHRAEQAVEQLTSQVVEPISATASQIANFLSSDEEDEESDDEFEAYTSLDIPEFKGRQGLNNFTILQEEHGFLAFIYDFYIFMLKRSVVEFCLGMFAAPVLLSMFFTLLYLPQFDGLALDETVREFLQTSEQNTKGSLEGLQMSWQTVFQVFMFSVSLSTGLQPELAPLSPYTLVVANLNALFAQLIFVFLSGAVFARLSQPSQPVKCSTVAIICPPPSNRRLRKEACYKALLTRYVLVGPQPCELVDVKVDLTYHYNTVTRSGTYFRTSQSLKLVRPEIAFLDHGMVVRHVIDETSPLYERTPAMLEKEDAVFSLSVVGLERSSMQSIFHVQHYCVYDKDIVWDAEFLDMILISKKNRRVVDHSLLSSWRKVIPT